MRFSLTRSTLVIVLLLAPLIPPWPAVGQESFQQASGLGRTQEQASIRETRRLVEALRQAGEIPSLSVAVGVGDRLVWAEGFGVAELETGSAANPTTRYRAASVSKVLTIAGVARLVAEGRLEMDTPVSSYVPSYPGPSTVTSRLLAGHLAGIRNYKEGDDALGLTDAAVMHLSACRNIEELSLTGNRFEDQCLVYASRLPKLKSLTVGDMPVSDEGLARLRPLKNLHELNLLGGSLSRAAMLELQQFPNLTSLHVDPEHPPDGGLEELRKVLPGAKIGTLVAPRGLGRG